MSVSRRKFLSTGLVIASGLILPGISLPGTQPFTEAGSRYVPVDPRSRDLLKKYLSESQKWPTAQACLICCEPLARIGGQKIIRSSNRGTALLDQAGSACYPNICVLEPLLENYDLYFTVWGEASMFTRPVVNRARREYLAGKQPWLCQKCGLRQCHLCGEPINVLAYGDYAFKSGRGFYCKGANLGANFGCVNPRCRSYRNMEA